MKQFLTLLFFANALVLTAQTGDFFDFGVREIKIYFAEKDWEKRLAETRTKNPNGRMTCAVSIDGQRFDEVGIRYKGNSSYKRTRRQGFRKLPFNIKLDHVRKEQKLANGCTTLKLANVTGDPSFVREPLSYEIARDYMPAPRANFIRVFVNDVFFGIYTNVESIDGAFLKRNFGTLGGSLVKCDPELDEKPIIPPSCDAILKTERRASLNVFTEDTLCYPAIYELEKGNFGSFHRMIKTLNSQPEKVDQVINADQALWMHAFNNVLVNLDSYSGLLCHNYYMWQDTAGRWQPLVWDLNLSFGGFKRAEIEQLSTQEMQKLPPMLHADNSKRPLIASLLRQPLYRKIYVAHVRTILNDWFLNGKYLARAREMQQAIEPWVNSDTIKLFDSKGFRENLTQTVVAQRSAKEKEEVIGLEELMKARTEFLATHPEIKKQGPIIEKPISKTPDGGGFEIDVKVAGAKKVWLFHSNTLGGSFQKTMLRDDGQEGDSLAADGQFFAKILKGKIQRFYLVAENDEAATCLPEKASHAPFQN